MLLRAASFHRPRYKDVAVLCVLCVLCGEAVDVRSVCAGFPIAQFGNDLRAVLEVRWDRRELTWRTVHHKQKSAAGNSPRGAVHGETYLTRSK